LVVVASEIHSDIRRLEQLLRWASQKVEALPSAAAWPLISGERSDVERSQLLVIRNSRANRDLARGFEETLRLAYPGRSADAVAALRDPHTPWPGASVIWADVGGGGAVILDRPPRHVGVGR
jgi:hypothetical protein